MNRPVISVEHLTKRYQLGVINSGTLAKDLNRWWARWWGKPDPYGKIGQEDLSQRRGDSILALDDVSFSVNQGEALGIIGKNGAGKSTLLKILSRVTAPTSGVVKVKGRIGSLLEVGTGFHPELTGRENVFLNGAILGMRRDEVAAKFDEIVDFSGVEKFIDTPVKRYSSGMYVRLAFAVAAHLDPEILVVDEVLAVGDAEFQKKCLGKMGDVAGEGRTVLFVSHNMKSINDLCNRSILLSNGSINKIGRTRNIIDYYITKREKNKHKVVDDEVRNRTLIGPSKITAVWLENDLGSENYHYQTYGNLTFVMQAIGVEDNAIIGISVRDSYDQVVIHLSNIDDKVTIKPRNSHSTIKVQLTNILLKGGDYFVTFWLGTKTNNLCDRWGDVLSFRVDDSHLGQSVSVAPFRLKANWQVK